jgi:hypothetical protein
MRSQVQDFKFITRTVLTMTCVELEDFEIQTPRRAKSFRQRLSEKKTRAKRLAMTKEANCWYMNQALSQTQAPPAWSYSSTSATRKKMAPPPKISQLRFKSATSSRQKTDAIQTTRWGAFLQYESDSSEAPSSSSNRFKTPKKSKGADTISARSVMSPVASQRILDALEWDS